MASDQKMHQTITKEMIVNALLRQLGLSRTICQEIVDNIFQEILKAAIDDQTITLRNFGRFFISHKKPRPGVNIRRKSAVTIPSRNVFRFTPAESFKSQINA